jgi:CCR4-NOT transcription complex subunit 6
MGASGSKGASGKAGSGAASIESRQIARKANKEDLFTVATYHILAESTLADSAYPYWQKKDRKPKRWQQQLLLELRTLAASVLCLQNVDSDLFQSLLKPDLAQLGYEGEFHKLPGKSTTIGVATFWHTRTFRLLKSHFINLNTVAKDAAKDARVEAKAARLLNGSGSLALVLQLLPDKHSKQHCVCVANTQLCGGDADVQALEAGLLLKELQGYAQHMQEFKDSAGLEETSVGYVVAGHLGGSPKSPQYGLLKNGRLDDKQHKKLSKSPSISAGKGMSAQAQPILAWFSSSFEHKWGALKSAYAAVIGKEPEYTVYTDRVSTCSDYVWYTGENLNANSALHVPDQSAIKPLGGLPNAQYPSDHVPLVFGFRFKKSDAFTSMLPFDQPGGAGRSTEDGAAAEEEDDMAPRDLDDILGFKTPTDATRYDRFGRERERSGIAAGEDLAPEAWKPAVPPRRDY